MHRSAPDAVSEKIRTPFAAVFRFGASSALLLGLAVLAPEEALSFLNLHTAAMAARCLEIFGYPIHLSGDVLSRAGFSVRVVTECTALYLVILFLCFTLSFQTTWRMRLAGLAAGIPALHAATILRITALFAVGADFPAAFEAVHVFAGQVISIFLVIAVSLAWARFSSVHSGRQAPASFLLRFLVFSSVAFLVWLPLNTGYEAAIDKAVSVLFSVFGYTLTIPRTHSVYFQTFSIVTLLGVVLAEQTAAVRRITVFISGCTMLIALHVLFRACNVLMTAFESGAAALVSLGAVIAAQYLAPFLALLALRYNTEKTLPGPDPRDDLFRRL